MARLLDDSFSRGFETLRCLVAHSRFTAELADAIRAKGGAERAISAMEREFFPTEANQPKWREENGVIYFSVTSDGTTGEEWITRIESKGFRVGDFAKQVLRSPDFKPTSGITTEVAVLKGSFFNDNDRITYKIRAKADEMKLVKPNADIACLIREQFSDKEIEAMGLIWIVVMHEPIEDSDGNPSLLAADRDGGGRWLDACSAYPGSRWRRGSGFAFLAPQVP